MVKTLDFVFFFHEKSESVLVNISDNINASGGGLVHEIFVFYGYGVSEEEIGFGRL